MLNYYVMRFSVEVFYEKFRKVTTKAEMENVKARKEINAEQFIVEWRNLKTGIYKRRPLEI